MKLVNADILDRAVVETLETRQMLSAVSFEGGVLSITGLANKSNNMTVRVKGHRVITNLNGDTSSRRLAGLKSITITGGDKNDAIDVDPRMTLPVTILSRAGNDRIRAGNGNDRIEGGAGNDVIYGQRGNDRISGNSGHDRVYGGIGRDTINGGTGLDRMHGGDSDDTFTHPEKRDRIVGGRGRDSVVKVGEGTIGSTPGDDDNTPPPDDNGTPDEPAPQVAGFTLINAATGRAITGFKSLESGDVLDLSKLPARLNIAANIDGKTSRVRFDFDGTKVYRIEDAAPYVLGGDNFGKYRAMTLAVGEHTVTAHTVDKATGEVLDTAGITFTVIKSSTGSGSGSGGGGTTPPPSDTGGGGSSGNDTGAGDPSDNGNALPSIENDDDAVRPTARITALSTTIPAGTSFHGDALASLLGKGDWQESQYLWDFGDSDSRFNKLKGFNVAHVYDQPGKYSVTLTVINIAGKQDSVTVNVTVTTANRQVIYVSEDGNDSNDGRSELSPIRSFAKAASLVDDNTEILFHRGDRFDVTDGMWINGTNIVIGAYGAGERPTLMWTGDRDNQAFFNTRDTAKNVTIEDLSIDTRFNKDTNDDGTPLACSVDGTNITVRRNEFLNLQYGVNLNGQPSGALIQDNEAPLQTGLRKYFAWVEGNRITIIGNKAVNSTREHIVRVNLVSKLLVMDNDFANISRRDKGDAWDYRKTALNVQSGEFAYVADNQLDGPVHIGPLGQDDGLKYTHRRFKYVVADSNEVVDDMLWVKHGAEHVMVRNNLIQQDGQTAINVDSFNSIYNRGVVDLGIYNNTAVNTDSHGRFAELWGAVEGGIKFVNNLYVAPNLVVGELETAGVRIHTTDLRTFTIDGNVYPVAKTVQSWIGEQAMNTIGDGYIKSVFRTASEWNKVNQIGTDTFANYKISGKSGVKLNGRIVGSAINGTVTVTTVPVPNPTPNPEPEPEPKPEPKPKPTPLPSAQGLTLGINVNKLNASNYGKIVSTLKKAGTESVRLWYGFDNYETKKTNGNVKYIKRLKEDGFHVMIAVVPKGGLQGTAQQTTRLFNHLVNIDGLPEAVDLWEVGNEPDAYRYWNGTLKEYVNDYLAPASKVLRGIGEKVVSAGVAWNPEDIKTMVNAGMLKYTDYVGYHPYRSSVEDLKACIDRVKSYVGDKPLIASEWNVRGHEKDADTSAWAAEIKEFWPVIRDNFYAAHYFVAVTMDSLAGPAGVMKPDGSANGVFYSTYMSFKDSISKSVLKAA
ncbi:MAG: PKD domain-containing protein [Burkholderiales bacterium]|nr:PKD domain-containing protein [Phycisphaerae bacterium]